MSLVFVYGTLRRGERNHGLLGESAFVATARTAPRYVLVDLGSHPAMIECGTDVVVGEIYDVSAAVLAALDELEEHPVWYRRVPVELEPDAPGSVECYVLPLEEAARYPRIASGDWRAHIARHRDRG